MDSEEIVFVYGSLKQGFGNHPLLMREKFLGDGLTREQSFNMMSYGRFPAVLDGGNQAIWGEIYQVGNWAFSRLDELEGNGSLYQRRKVPILMGDEVIQAWIYVLIADNDYAKPEGDEGVELLDIEGINVANWVGRQR